MWEDIETMDVEKKNPQYYTFMAVPHSNDKVFRVRISHKLIKVIAAVAMVSALAVIFLTGSYFDAKKDAAELEELRATNSELKNEVGDLNDRAATLKEKMADLQRIEENIRNMLELGEVDASRVAALTTNTTNNTNTTQQISRSFSRSRGEARVLPGVSEANYMTNALGFSVLEQDLGPAGAAGVDIQEVQRLTVFLEAKIDSLDEAMNKLNTDVTEWKAYMNAKPSIWPVAGQITSRFGYRKSPFGGGSTYHAGIDIGAKYGADIKATGAGVVERAGYYYGYGLCVVVNHGYGIKTAYGHNSRVKVKVGERVQKGQVIAAAGSSGRSTGTHLHYEVLLNGTPVDPTKYLP